MQQGYSSGMTAAAPSRRKRRSPAELRDLILAAAARAFEAGGYAGATTAAIAREAGTTEAQIFRLFPSKADLFRAAVFDPLNRHFSAFQTGAITAADPRADRAISHRQLSERYIAELQDFIGSHARMLLSLIVAQAHQAGGGGLEAIDGLDTYFARGAALMQARTGDAAPVPPDLMVRVSFAAVLGNVLFRDWLFPPGVADAEAIRKAIADFTIGGLNANG